MGGGGGQAPKCTDIKKKNHIYVTYMHERAKRASVSEHIGLYFLIWYGAINDSIGQNTDIEKIYE